MGRPNASPTTQVNQQPQENHFQSVSQSPETNYDEPLPLETYYDENQQESSGKEPSEASEDNGQNNQHSSKPQKQSPSAREATISSNRTQAPTPMTFPPQSSQVNASQAAQYHQMRAPTGAGGVQPPRANPQAFPPSQDKPQAFPPHATTPQAFSPQPQAFPPSENVPQAIPPQASPFPPQAFPPSQGKPQAFPPQVAFPPQFQAQPQALPTSYSKLKAFPQADQQPQAFPPPQGVPQAFPPKADHHQPQAFPPVQDEPQAFPPKADHHQPQAFPPVQDEPQAFPPKADPHQPQAFPTKADPHQPQAFPPAQDEPQDVPPKADHYQPHAFPPARDEPQSFPPSEGQPQAFPPQQATFQQQHINGMQFPQNANFFHPSTMGAQPMPASPFHPTPQMMMNNARPGIPVINQNPIIQVPTENWKTGLFECMNDPTNALLTAFFPCVTFGQIAEIIDSGQTPCATSGLLYGMIACCIAMPCLMSCTYRTKLRRRFGLFETPAPDWFIHCFCEWCALCQEFRELKERGLDPSIGWLGNVNVQRQRVQQAAMTPPMRQTMMG